MKHTLISGLIFLFVLAVVLIFKFDVYGISPAQVFLYGLAVVGLTFIKKESGFGIFIVSSVIVIFSNLFYVPRAFGNIPHHILVWHVFMPLSFLVLSEGMRRGIIKIFAAENNKG